MKQIFFILFLMPNIMHAQTLRQLNSSVTTINKKNTVQDSSILQINAKNTAQDNSIALINSKNATQDNSIAIMSAKNTAQDTGINYLYNQLRQLQSQNLIRDSLILNLQQQINDVQHMAMVAIFDANHNDSLINVPGETTITKISPNIFSIGIFNFAQLIQRIQNLEAKLPNIK